MTEQILARIDALLDETGSDKTKILTDTLYITDMALKDEMNVAWTAWFAAEMLPSRSTIGVAELGPQILIEAVITAARRSPSEGDGRAVAASRLRHVPRADRVQRARTGNPRR